LLAPEDALIQVGSIVGVHGIKGWIKLFSYTDPAEQILSYYPWHVRQNGKTVAIEVAEVRQQGKKIQVRLKDNHDRNQAEAWVGATIWTEKTYFPQLPEGEFYWHELIGLTVDNTDGETLGTVARLVETGANDVLVVEPINESIDDLQRLIPYVEPQFVLKVDLETRSILVNWSKDY
jgi:16S rRNA processing protein RimM|tara:strand:+ start:619 stop:1149 length:531 start_codon:yes stop_codon:yes gene_type:complete